jgi:tripartite-type tricarboxylate transporter receptor subunit TctC
MLIDRRQAMAGLGAAALGGSAAARAQEAWPSKPITILAGAAAGSQTDVFSRVLAAPLQQRLGRPVVVENRPGAGGIIAAQAAARAAPDGHTIILGSNSPFVVSPHLRDPLPYVTPRDLAPIALAMNGPSIIVVKPELPVRTGEELVAHLKANPGRLNLGSHGVGSFSHVAMELFMAETGTEMVHIPYNGGGPLTTAFLAGDVDVVCFDIFSIASHVRTGRARIVAQVGEQRSPLFPDTPLISEGVAPNVKADYWLGVFAPAGTPQPILQRLHEETVAIFGAPENRARVEQASMLVNPISMDEFAAKVRREWDEWGRVIRARNIRAG